MAEITCPHCDGEKYVIVFADGHHADGTPFHDNGPRACSTCNGTGNISAEHQQRIEDGHQKRLERLGEGLTLLEAARLAGISPAELSAIECGRVVPSKSGGA